MDAVIFIEELGRNGEVVRRHRRDSFPVRIGRGYDADVIVDDPYVAASHLEIRCAGDGAPEVVDLGSKNGTLLLGRKGPFVSTRIDGGEVFRIGRTQLRIRLPGHAVPPEMPLRGRTWDRQPGVFVGSVVATMGLLAWFEFLNRHGTNTSDIIVDPLLGATILLAWVAIWTLVCRTLNGWGTFFAHGIVAFIGCAFLLCSEALAEYLVFAFDARGSSWVILTANGTVLAGMLFRHLRLTVRLAPRLVGALSIALVGLLLATTQGVKHISAINKPGLQQFNTVIKPTAFLVTRGTAPADFFSAAAKLKARADADAGMKTR